MSDLAASPARGATVAEPPTCARTRRRFRPRQFLAKSHRWSSLALGLLLLAIVISGVVLLLEPEIEGVVHPSLFDTAPGPTKVTPGQALQTAHRRLPDLELSGATVWNNRGAWDILAAGKVTRVDDTSGRLLGTLDREHGVLGFLANLHECALGCEGMTGYVPFLGKPAQIAGFDLSLGNEGTWGGMILLVSGLLLLLLTITGLVLWWPGRKRWRRGLEIRRGRGRYKFQWDLHKVVGFVALPFLAVWAITGVNFELPKQTEAAWFAVTPGSAQPESDFEFESKPGSGPGIGMAAAIERARAAVPPGSTLDSVSKPVLSEKASYYELWWTHGVDPYAYGNYPGNYGVYVDRYSGRAVRYWADPGNGSVTAGFWQNWTGPLHMGNAVGWIPRLGWVAFGLTPLLLAATGVTTWLMRRRLRRRKRGGGDGNGVATA